MKLKEYLLSTTVIVLPRLDEMSVNRILVMAALRLGITLPK